ncbi:hypothetical protein GCM10023331_06760 [Algivirga pacifica]|uniref:Carrier domain-containing protein n=2 Tax=Algivirga pacifica TaxID=1162670 RepID=A0ABP9D151_9BACT
MVYSCSSDSNQSARDKVEQGAQDVEDEAGEIADETRGAAEEAEEGVEGAWEDTKDAAEETWDQTKQTAEEGGEWMEEKASDAEQAVEDERDQLMGEEEATPEDQPEDMEMDQSEQGERGASEYFEDGELNKQALHSSLADIAKECGASISADQITEETAISMITNGEEGQEMLKNMLTEDIGCDAEKVEQSWADWKTVGDLTNFISEHKE